ncbi:MAG TPA: NAD-glutamate dehydrogenase domain-containing protein, partial [Gammaproteobacteria bacterium]|nr:NAD-glutamate dehydrogenase domain-containing protein [Gammaproteobacteria bacterium]
RSLKSIALSPEMRAALGTDAAELTPNELIRTILSAPVDLLFNGGIGTYVKSSHESHADVGDKTNEFCRINGGELRCKVVGEGGNLGFTQLGRVEYALKGGLINTDFIDNSAGVDCSDHEVNLKILLDQDVAAGKLSESSRNAFLATLTQEVAALVLKDNEDQALVMSFSAESAKRNIGLHQHFLQALESANAIDRRVEFLPDDKTILERKAAGLGFTRPEIAVLLAYSKIQIKHEILASTLTEDANLNMIVETAFPPTVREKYSHLMKGHRLYRDIVATQLSNKVVNEMGITFVYRMQMETGASIDNIIHAYTIASAVFKASELRHLIENLGVTVPLKAQYEMLFQIRTLISLATRWFLHSRHLKNNMKKTIEHFSVRIEQLKNLVPNLMGGETKKYLANLIESFHQKGLSQEDARTIATYRAIYTTLNIVEVATQHQFDLEQTAQVYFLAGEKLNLLWFRDQISKDTREGHWNALARLTLRDELDIAQRALTIAVIKSSYEESHPEILLKGWLERNKMAIHRWDSLLAMLHASPDVDYTMFFIAIRELLGLVMNSMHEQGIIS